MKPHAVSVIFMRCGNTLRWQCNAYSTYCKSCDEPDLLTLLYFISSTETKYINIQMVMWYLLCVSTPLTGLLHTSLILWLIFLIWKDDTVHDIFQCLMTIVTSLGVWTRSETTQVIYKYPFSKLQYIATIFYAPVKQKALLQSSKKHCSNQTRK